MAGACFILVGPVWGRCAGVAGAWFLLTGGNAIFAVCTAFRACTDFRHSQTVTYSYIKHSLRHVRKKFCLENV